MAYTDVFGGELLFPSQLSYLSITTAVDITLQWPREQQIGGTNVVADFLDINTTVISLNIDMPSASATSTGNKTTFNNVGANAFTVRDSTGGTIQSVGPGEQWVLILTDNSTAAGAWVTYQLGATVAVADASALAGAGIKAIGSLLNQQIDSDVEAATPITVVDGDRAKCLIYTAGAGTCNLPGAGTVGNDWFFMLRNSGSGTLNVVPPAGTIDGLSDINLDPNDSAFIFTDGANYFTIGLSSGSTIAFSFITINIPGSGDFVLDPSQQNQISYRFTGALTGNRKIVVPNTTQQYWVDNQTTGAFTLTIGTAAQVTPPALGQGDTAIFYCDSTDIINAVSTTAVVFPISIAQGGTGATTASGARGALSAAFSGQNMIAGSGIGGGGDLSADRTFTMDVNDLASVAPATGDFLAFEDIDGGNTTEKATISDILALAAGLPAGNLNDIIYISTAPDTYSATNALSVDPGTAVTVNDDLIVVDTLIDLNNSAAATLASLQARNSAGGVRLDIIATTGNARIVQADSAGSLEDIWVQMTRNGGVELRNNNTAVARTLAAGSGGLEANNTSTGAGFERVLTTSDISGGGLTLEAFVKPAQTQRSNTTTVTADPDLAGYTVAANTFYRIEGFISYSGASASSPDMDCAFSLPAAAGLVCVVHIYDQQTNTFVSEFDMVNQTESTWPLNGTFGQIGIVRGRLQTSGTAGTVDFEWAQAVSSGFINNLLAGSWLSFGELT